MPSNPPNRYERLHVQIDPADDPDLPPGAPAVPTVFYRDASRSILAENESPDVGFRFSLNPYRGCEHGCVYCLAPDTPVLHGDLGWRPIGDVRAGDVLTAFDEHPEPGGTRRLRHAVVEAVRWSRRPTLRLVTDRTEVLTTAEHRWLQAGDLGWSRTDRLSPGRRLCHLPVAADEPCDDDYGAGYLAGRMLGDGTFCHRPGRRRDRPFSAGSPARRTPRTVGVRSLVRLAAMQALVTAERDGRSFRRGFLAGFVDAGGGGGDPVGVAQLDPGVLARVQRYRASLGFRFRPEPRPGGGASAVGLDGGLAERVRFFAVCRPAVARTMRAMAGREMAFEPEPIRRIEPGPVMDVVDIQTSTRTFCAAGLATHNCYARPSHEYLGFSAGLDFESRIMVKDDAPALLRATFMAKRWEPEVVALSGNTDCYQPVERRLGITRRCLEVFAEFRNPVSAITKSALVVRDADLYAELARHGAAQVFVSLTTLDAALAARLEPRAARPERRLAAIAALAAAGVPVGVMVAPVIPGLNDVELPRLLAAAAEAGARSAGWVLLRLAKPLDALFDAWLAEHYPERRTRVLNRIRDTRAGRLSDATFGRRMRGQGEYAAQIGALFAQAARRHGLDRSLPALRSDAFRRPPRPGEQLPLL